MSSRPTRAPGTTCRISPYDTVLAVEAGDFVITSAGTSAYLVLAAREVNRRAARRGHGHRWDLSCLRVEPADVPTDAVVHELTWYPRKKHPATG